MKTSCGCSSRARVAPAICLPSPQSAGAQVRHLRPSVPTLEDVFAQAVGEDVAMPIHDQGYRRYVGTRTPRGRAWAVITTAGLRTFFGRRAFLALLLLSWLPFVVRAVQILRRGQLSADGLHRPDRRNVQAVSGSAGRLRVLRHRLRRCRPDRQRSARQCPADLPVEAAHPRRVRFRQDGDPDDVSADGDLAAGRCSCCSSRCRLPAASSFFGSHLYLFPAITLFSFVQAAMVSATMLALSSLSNNSRFVGIIYAGLIFFSDALFGVLRAVTGESRMSWVSFGNNLAQIGDVMFSVPLRFSTPWPVSLLMIVALVAVSAFILERRVRGVEVIA